MQHLPFYWNISFFFLCFQSQVLAQGCNVSSHFFTLSEGHFGELLSLLMEMEDQLPLHQIKGGMREKGEKQEWGSTACNRLSQDLLPEFRNFFSSHKLVTLYLFLFCVCWKFFLQHHSGVGSFQEGCLLSFTCVPHSRRRRRKDSQCRYKDKNTCPGQKKITLSAVKWTETPNFSPRPLGSCQIQTGTALPALEKLSLIIQREKF